MSRKNHEWVLGEEAPAILPHSLVKHRILSEYLSLYVETLTSNPNIPQLKLSIVDGFSGGGIYSDPSTRGERPGSPLIALEAMKTARAGIQLARNNPFNLDVEYFFVEKNQGAQDYLRQTLLKSEFRGLVDSEALLLKGGIESHIDQIIGRIQERRSGERAIFIFDQFGYVDAPFPMIRKVLDELENAEVILTFGVDFLITYLNSNPKSQGLLKKMELKFSDSIENLKQDALWRRHIQRELNPQIQRNTGATYYTPFFIRSKAANRDYWLIHLSKHAKARDVMTQLHWRLNNACAHYGLAGLNMLGYDQDRDAAYTGTDTLPIFQFDKGAREVSRLALIEDIPGRMADHFPDGLTFNEFFARVTNETPATSLILREALAQLRRQEVIVIRDKYGNKIPSIRSGKDFIKYQKTGRLFLP